VPGRADRPDFWPRPRGVILVTGQDVADHGDPPRGSEYPSRKGGGRPRWPDSDRALAAWSWHPRRRGRCLRIRSLLGQRIRCRFGLLRTS
jgi:hypothetical protein